MNEKLTSFRIEGAFMDEQTVRLYTFVDIIHRLFRDKLENPITLDISDIYRLIGKDDSIENNHKEDRWKLISAYIKIKIENLMTPQLDVELIGRAAHSATVPIYRYRIFKQEYQSEPKVDLWVS